MNARATIAITVALAASIAETTPAQRVFILQVSGLSTQRQVEQRFLRWLDEPIIVDFDNVPLGPVIGGEWLESGVKFAPPSGGGLRTSRRSANQRPLSTPHSLWPTGSEHLSFEFLVPTQACGLWVVDSEKNSGADRLEFLDAAGRTITDVLMPSSGRITSGTSAHFFVGVVVDTPSIARVNVMERGGDGEAVGIDNVTFQLPGSVAPPYLPSAFRGISPAMTFLRTDPNDSTGAPLAIDLDGLGLLPGDRIRVRTNGSFEMNTLPPVLTSDLALAVFSQSGVVGPTSRRDRLFVGGRSIAIPAPGLAPFVTLPTAGGLATDIDHDFLVTPFARTLTVPSNDSGRAPFLLLGANDQFWGDNAASQEGFGVEIEVLSPSFPRTVLTLDDSRAEPCGTRGTIGFGSVTRLIGAYGELTSGANFGLDGLAERPIDIARVVSEITEDSLRGVDVVIVGPLRQPGLTACEVMRLERFVNAGGGVFVFGDRASEALASFTGCGPINSCGLATTVATGSHPILSGSFGPNVTGFGTVEVCEFGNPGPQGTVFLRTASGGNVGAAFEIGAGRVVTINDEEFLMSSGGCRARPFWNGGDVRSIFLNSIEWLQAPRSFDYAAPTTCVDAATVTYGVGCPGANGLPTIRAVGLPAVGSVSFAVELAGALPGAPTALAIAGDRSDFTFGLACVFHLGIAPVSFPSQVSTQTGTGIQPFPIPNVPGLAGLEVQLQWLVQDASGGIGGQFAASPGMAARVGF